MKPRPDDWPLGLDSFLDIVTNVIGFLMLIALLAAIGSQNMSVLLTTPILRAAPQEASRVLFECRHDRILRIDDEAINRSLVEALRPLDARPGTKLDVSQVPALLERTEVGDASYRVRAEVAQSKDGAELVLIYEPRARLQGEPIESLQQPTSPYVATVRSLDPQKHFAYFIVRQDSFEIFRKARQIARDHGLATGWHPHPLDDQLRFSKEGVFGGDIQ